MSNVTGALEMARRMQADVDAILEEVDPVVALALELRTMRTELAALRSEVAQLRGAAPVHHVPVGAVAEALGMTRNGAWRRLKAAGIEPDHHTSGGHARYDLERVLAALRSE